MNAEGNTKLIHVCKLLLFYTGMTCFASLVQFRAAIQLQFDFHRAIYNLGTVLVSLLVILNSLG